MINTSKGDANEEQKVSAAINEVVPVMKITEASQDQKFATTLNELVSLKDIMLKRVFDQDESYIWL